MWARLNPRSYGNVAVDIEKEHLMETALVGTMSTPIGIFCFLCDTVVRFICCHCLVPPKTAKLGASVP